MNSVAAFVERLTEVIVYPIMWLLFALALFFFVNGVVGYILKSDEPKERAKGTQHMLWGIIGIFIMTSVLLILRALLATFDITPPPGTLE